jgi:DNA-binding transcriptional regulator YiaG
MAEPERYRSDIARSVHRTVRGLHRIGLVDNTTMSRFDAKCLKKPAQRSPKKSRPKT